MLDDLGYLTLEDAQGTLIAKEYLSSRNTLLSTTVRDSDGTPDPGEVKIADSTAEVSSVFKDLYITELSKLRAPTGNWPFHLEERILQKYYLRNEIQAVKPKLVIGMGQRPRQVLTELASERISDRSYHLPTSDKSPRFLITLDHPFYPSADYKARKDDLKRALKRSPPRQN